MKLNTALRLVVVPSIRYLPVKLKIARTRLPELIAVLGSQPAGDVSHKLGGRLPLLSARFAVAVPRNS